MSEVLADLPINIPIKEVYRYLGYPESCQEIPPALRLMVEEEIAAALPLIQPKAAYATYDYDKKTNRVVLPEQKTLIILGSAIRNHLHNCAKVTVFACTISSALEPAIDMYFKTGEYTRALILDAIGSAAVEYATDILNQYILAAAHRQNYRLVSRFSPGYGDWDLSIQQNLVRAAGGDAAGIRVTESSLLVPRKSVSGIIGWVPDKTSQEELPTDPCSICKIKDCNNPICKGGTFS